MSPSSVIPYCGLPPDPSAIWLRWNLDPVLIAALVALAAVYEIASERSVRRRAPICKGFFYCGWTVLTFALISPLCPLSVSLFSARVGQHVLLTMFAAPLIAAGLRGLDASPAMVAIARALRRSPILAASAFGLLLWFWHAPAPYAATFTSYLTYWLMHITLIATAVWLWSALIDTSPENSLSVLLAGVMSTVQMGFLGALITFVPRAIYTPHLLTTGAWGLTPLQDQQLGGVVMWVPGCVIFLLAASAVLWRVMEQAGQGSIALAAPERSRKFESPVPVAVEAK